MKIDVKLSDTLLSNLKKIGMNTGEGVAEEKAEKILKRAQDYCPVDTGNLKNSGYIEKTNLGFEVGFSAEYASFVHEMPQSKLKNGVSQYLKKAYIEVLNGGE